MVRRKKDKFMQEMGRINTARRRRKTRRAQERSSNRGVSPWRKTQEDLSDSLYFRTQEVGALGKEVTKGVIQESAKLAFDMLAGVVTLGLTLQPLDTPRQGRSKRRRRR